MDNDSVTDIGIGAFYGCSSITSLTIPNHINIDKNMFYSVASLIDMTMPSRVEEILEGKIRVVQSYSSITIPDHVKIIKESQQMENKNFGVAITKKIFRTAYSETISKQSLTWTETAFYPGRKSSKQR